MYKDPAKNTAYTLKYRREHLRRYTLDLRSEDYDVWKAAADARGMPLAAFIKSAVNQAIANNN